MHRSASSFGTLLSIVCLTITGHNLSADPTAQTDQTNATPPEIAGGVIMPFDRTAERNYHTAIERIAENQFTDAVQLLSAILRAPADSFMRAPIQGNIYRSVKSLAVKAIQGLPRRGRQTYELLVGVEATEFLNRARRSHDLPAIEQIIYKYPMTDAAVTGSNILGTFHMDRAAYREAVVFFERIVRWQPSQTANPLTSIKLAVCYRMSGRTQSCVELIAATPIPTRTVRIAGLPVDWIQPDENALTWIDDIARRMANSSINWPVTGANVARNSAEIDTDSPLLVPQWSASLEQSTRLTRFMDRIISDYDNREELILPSLQPLVVDDMIVAKSTHALHGLNRHSGQRIWTLSTEEDPAILVPQDIEGISVSHAVLGMSLVARLFRDATFGGISADNQQVYAIKKLGLTPQPRGRGRNTVVWIDNRAVVMRDVNYSRFARTSTNSMVACDIRTGRLNWTADNSDDDASGTGFYFLGAPLPIGNQLFALVDREESIELLCLNAQDGSTLWRQPLVTLERNQLTDPERRISGLSPSYSNGILVCPLGAEAIAAFDLVNHGLVWARTFGSSDPDVTATSRARATYYQNAAELRGWTDGLLTIAGTNIIAHPGIDGDLYCLNLEDGSVRWRTPRNDAVHVAGVSDGKVIVVGEHKLSAYELASGKPAWPSISIPMIAGRGIKSGDRYHLPLRNGSLAVVNMKDGQLTNQIDQQSPDPLGNLVATDGQIYSQSIQSIRSFGTLDRMEQEVERNLEADPQDAQSLALSTNILLQKNQSLPALQTSKQLLALKESPLAKRLFVTCVLRAVGDHYESIADDVAQARSLASTDNQQLALLKSIIEAQLTRKEWAAAAQTLLEVALHKKAASTPLPAIGAVALNYDVWATGKLKRLQELDGAELSDWYESLDASIKLNSSNLSQLQSLAPVLESAAIGQRIMGFLATTHREKEDWLIAEQYLRRQLASPHANRLETLQELASIYASANRAGPAARIALQLLHETRDVSSDAKRDVQQFIETLSKDPSVSTYLESERMWAKGSGLSIKEGRNPISTFVYTVTIGRPIGPIADSGRIELALRDQRVGGYDDLGRKLWSTELRDEDGARIRSLAYANSARRTGHLAVIAVGQDIFAVDTLNKNRDGAKLLWTKDFKNGPAWSSRPQGVRPQIVVRNGVRRVILTDYLGATIGNLGAICESYVSYHERDRLELIDTITGRTLWTRRGVMREAQVFGDRNVIGLMHRESQKLALYDAVDGVQLGEQTIQDHITSLDGRYCTLWTEPQSQLSRYDLINKTTVWQRTFPAGSIITETGEGSVAVLCPTGDFILVRPDNGELLLTAKLPIDQECDQMTVRRSLHQILVILHTKTEEDVSRAQILMGVQGLMVDGFVHALDPQGGLRWSQEIRNQSVWLDQPRELPFLIFSHWDIDPEAAASKRYKLAIECLDLRSGKIAYQKTEGERTIRSKGYQYTSGPGQVAILFPFATLSFAHPFPPKHDSEKNNQ